MKLNFSIKDISEIEEDFYTQDHSLFIEFISSLWFALISNTDLVCYLLVFIHMVMQLFDCESFLILL